MSVLLVNIEQGTGINSCILFKHVFQGLIMAVSEEVCSYEKYDYIYLRGAYKLLKSSYFEGLELSG